MTYLEHYPAGARQGCPMGLRRKDQMESVTAECMLQRRCQPARPSNRLVSGMSWPGSETRTGGGSSTGARTTSYIA